MSNPDLATRPVFVHVHVPKSGGTSLNTLLNHWFGGRIQWMQFSDPTRMFTQGEMDDYVWRNIQVDCITSHHFRVFPPVIAGRPALYLALLRNPVDCLISLARHTMRETPKLTPEFRSVLPANLDELNVAGLLSYWINEALESADSELFFGASFSRMFFEKTVESLGLGNEKRVVSKTDQAWSQWVAKGVAVAQLNQFFFVGDFANLAGEIQRLAELLKPFGFACQETDLPWERRSAGQPFVSLEEEQKFRAQLEEVLLIDREVYRHFFPN
jgi:hypothetical protein